MSSKTWYLLVCEEFDWLIIKLVLPKTLLETTYAKCTMNNLVIYNQIAKMTV